jgi:hypothetical protein
MAVVSVTIAPLGSLRRALFGEHVSEQGERGQTQSPVGEQVGDGREAG